MDVELDEINQETERYIRYESDVLILKMRKHCSIYEAAAVRKRRPGSVMRAMSEDKVIEWSWENLMKNARSAIKRFHLTLQKVEKERKDLLLILARRMLYYKNEIIQHQRSLISLRPVSSFRVEGVGPLMKAVSSVDFSKTRDSTLVQIANLLARWQGQSTKAESELASSSSMEAGINFLSSIIQNMLSLYKQALMNVYTGVYDILASLHQDIQNTRIYKLGKRQSLIEEVFSDRATDHLTDAEVSGRLILCLHYVIMNDI
ncbi:hypothetical protein C0J52_12600 [Blattella germanica]|nr:hypothetical protein C0J52_12600 [Blattella germanica]